MGLSRGSTNIGPKIGPKKDATMGPKMDPNIGPDIDPNIGPQTSHEELGRRLPGNPSRTENERSERSGSPHGLVAARLIRGHVRFL